MKAGKITAKLRDAVKVCFMVEGEEVKRYKNIEMPDALKELEIRDFHFNVLTDGKIEFWLHFDQGVLPEEWPKCRERKTRPSKVRAQAVEATEALTLPEMVAEPMKAKETIESDIALAQTQEVEIVQASEKKPAKRGRKPGSRFNKIQAEDVAI